MELWSIVNRKSISLQNACKKVKKKLHLKLKFLLQMQSANIKVLYAVCLMMIGKQRPREVVRSDPRAFEHVCKERGVSKHLHLKISEWRLLMSLSYSLSTIDICETFSPFISHSNCLNGL